MFRDLREANLARQKEWDSKGELSLSFKGNEAFGELGEAIEVIIDLLGYSAAIASAGGRASNHIKKLDREALGLAGSRTTNDALAEELADVLICIDLIAIHQGIDLNAALVAKFNKSSEKLGLLTRMSL